jgi:hypothetical protein
MQNNTPKKFVKLLASLIAATLVAGCSVGTAPTEPGGNSVKNGSLIWYVSATKGSVYGDGTTLATSFLTLQQAEAVALPGDTVEVDSGTYTNNNGPVLDLTTPGSAAGGYITWEPIPGATPVIQIGADAYGAVQFEQASGYTIFEGFTVLGYNKSLSLAEGVACQGSNGVQTQCIQNNGGCIAINGSTSPTIQQQSAGFYVPNHIQILNNTVAYCGGGIGASGADYITFSGNTVYDNAWYSIYGSSAFSMLGSYNSNPSDTATKYKMQITNNTIYGNAEFIPWIQQGIITDGEGIIMDSNLNASYGAGITYPAYTGRFLLANNIIWNDGSAAIEIFESAHVDVINNSTFNDDLNQNSEAGRGELSISGNSYDVNVFNNIFYSSTAGKATPVAQFSQCTPTPCNIDYNIYYGGLPNNWGGFGSNGPHDQVINPMYTSTPTPTLSGSGIGTSSYQPTDVINAPMPNLKLLFGSPAIGKGTGTFNGYSAPATDIVGNPRPSANGYTIGAYSQ